MLVNTTEAGCFIILPISSRMPVDCNGLVSMKDTISIWISFALAASSKAVSSGRVLNMEILFAISYLIGNNLAAIFQQFFGGYNTQVVAIVDCDCFFNGRFFFSI